MRSLEQTLGVLALSVSLPARAAPPAHDVRPPPANVVATGAQPGKSRSRKLVLTEFHLGGGAVRLPGGRIGGFSRLGGGTLRTRGPQPLATTLGMGVELESWFHTDGGGTALALLGAGGLRFAPGFATVGVGANLFTIDNLDGDKGVGVLSPRGGASFGVELATFRLTANADVQWRWRFGASPLPLFQLGATAGFAFGD